MNRTVTLNSSTTASASWGGPAIALFWDQSLVWGFICLNTLSKLSIPFHLLNSADIAGGALEHYRVLLVPGGWAAHKIRVLGNAGRRQINRFIDRGGSYLGFCGGAGMALSSPPCLELVPFERMPLAERLPNSSGEVRIRGVRNHPAWKNLPEEISASIWWPAQFAWQPLPRSLPVGFYSSPGKDFWIADLPLSDLAAQQMQWKEWEKIYRINLNPARLLGQPAILEVRKGKGRLILSYPHLETPGDSHANTMLLNILEYLDRAASKNLQCSHNPPLPHQAIAHHVSNESFEHVENIRAAVDDLIAFGERHLLWYWHLPWLLRWQRGIRGLEYSMLAVTVRFFQELSCPAVERETNADPWLGPIKKLEQDIGEFCRQAKALLLEEKLAAHSGSLTKLGKVNERVDGMRSFLFGNRMNHGGLCRTIFDELDSLLLQLLKQAETLN
jgi:hypothetical protein